ncbi:hypothetical protein H9655_02205 [Cytobacillus sp. Sa5YUA1]|uniref:YqfQ-like protein n=2 Tax=Bacillaceae TaxID=186817 RepID=A0ABR8QJY2_9BACI|nr:hypothetical protein [Cytobacillus stercorigallinarum]
MGPNRGQRPGFPPPHQTPQMMQNFSGRPPFPPNMTPYGPNQPRNSGGMRNNGSPRSGGLLSKILGGRGGSGGQAVVNTATNAATGSRAAGGAGILQTLTNPTNISGFLTNTQKFLNTAGQIAPMVQQYGPMVKNIPSMWKLYRGLKNMNSTTEEKEEEIESSSLSPIKDSQPSPSAVKTKKEKSVTVESLEDEPIQQPPTKASGQSIPKLYV